MTEEHSELYEYVRNVTEHERIADAVLTPMEAKQADEKELSPAEYVKAKYDLNPVEYDSEHALNTAIRGRRQKIEASEPEVPDVELQARTAAGTETIADSVLTPIEAAEADERGISAAQLVREKYSVDPSNYPNERALDRAISQQIQAGQ